MVYSGRGGREGDLGGELNVPNPNRFATEIASPKFVLFPICMPQSVDSELPGFGSCLTGLIALVLCV